MKFAVTHLSKQRRIITKIKNDFDNSFRNDVFIMRWWMALDLPDGVYQVFKVQGLRYVKVVVQISGLFIFDNITS